MEILFLNKNRPLMALDLDPKTSYVKNIIKVYDEKAMPVAMFSEDKETLSENFTEWWQSRAIPATRRQIQEKLAGLGYPNLQEIINRSLGLSLSDQYWIKPLGSEIAWKDVNYFTNSFSSEFGKYLLGETELENLPPLGIHFRSPDITSNGDVQKRWEMKGKERYLLKTGTRPYVQEPFNEQIAARVLRCMSVPFVDYTVIERDGKYFSSCKDFIDENHEFVPAYYPCKAMHPQEKILPEELLAQAIEAFNIPDTELFLDQMLILDYLIMNTDRHWTNFGFIRNVETLKFEGLAPIFDNGNSLWYDMSFIPEYYDKALTFRKKHEKQIRLVHSFRGVNLQKLETMPPQIKKILLQNKNISQERAVSIALHFQERVKSLTKIRENFYKKQQ